MRITIDKLVYGGSGLARTDIGVVFVPRTAPGDVAEVEVVERKKDYAVARVVRILEPSPDRQEPTCPNYETAGCCHWQHITETRQVDFKEDILRETLKRTGRIDWTAPITRISGPHHHYRLRAQFHVRDRQLGFVREQSHAVAPIHECSALSEPLNAFIPEANAMLATPDMDNVIEVHAIAGTTVAATFMSEHGSPFRIPPEGPPRIDVNGFTFELHPDAFFQSNRFLLGWFMAKVLELAGEEPRRVLDLYCGAGFFSIPLAKRSLEVLGVESSNLAVKQGRRNAILNGLDNVEFVDASVEMALEGAELKPDLILLNPPRAGCGKVAAAYIARLRAPRVVYVSCNPATFAREAAVFSTAGYTLNQVTMIDQFPGTYHIELAAQFELR